MSSAPGRKILRLSNHWIQNGCKLPDPEPPAHPADVYVVHAEKDYLRDETLVLLESSLWYPARPHQELPILTENDLTAVMWRMIQRWEFANRAGPGDTLQSRGHQHSSKMGQWTGATMDGARRPVPWLGESSANTASSAPAREWENSIASLWENSRFEGLQEALASPGEETYIKHVAIPCGVDHG